ncbi:glycosyltransferase family 39 protein [Favolaschia claudopus]|uniref:Dolichyl-phosphate-mannose--protein mannosyltransferase n=1 Tax=Favolaschia claudopus TaxID=2862362 RepID=A0AAW0C344_9AGAR
MSESKGVRRRNPRGAVSSPSVLDAAVDPKPDDGGKGIDDKPLQGAGKGLAGITPANFLLQNLDHVAGLVYTLLSFWTRFYKIGHSEHVVWDEAHFGKFASHYLKREFYFDVHPPLGKMLVALAGYLAGYDGSFEFKSGEVYTEDVPFTAMRMILATFGVAMVPVGWYTAIELGMSRWACHLVALMVLLDVGWLCISRFILLDSMLLFFIVFTVFCLTKFNNKQSRPFSIGWWYWLTLTGLGIGCVTSVKMVGMFVTALVGLYTVEDLWEKFGDLKMPVREQIKHWTARVVCLIILPFLVFMASFKIHFIILNESGPGDSQMSSLFQANLQGNDFAQNPLEIAYGSRITVKNMGLGGGLLHSHPHVYPGGSGQQQITCYHHKDSNNEWEILTRWDEPPYDPEGPIRFVHNNDIVRLAHIMTTRNLHSHLVPGPITKLNHEVSCYGNTTIGDIHDYWQVEVVDDLVRGSRANVDRVHALTTRLRFRHQVLGCYLRADSTMLPQWGWKQAEVTCTPQNNPNDPHTYWNVESHWNDRLPPADIKHLKTSFLRDFWHLNVAMMNSNNALIPDPDKEDILASTPFDWPFLHLGLRMCGWGDTQTKYYLMGNPIVWWGGAMSLIVGLGTFGVYLLRMQRKYFVMNDHDWNHFLYVGKVAFIGWCLHYVPFIIMGRVTYVHHYLPTLYFAVLMFAHMLDHFVFSSRQLAPLVKQITFGICASAVIGTFWWFKGVAFGIDGPIGEHKGLAWRKTWNIYNL